MSEDKPPESLDKPESLEDLDARVSAALAKNEPPRYKEEGALGDSKSGMGLAFRIGVELVSAVFMGVVIGLFLDKWLETGPLFLVVFLFVGAGAGFLNIYRTVSGIGLAIGYGPPTGKEPEKEDRK